MVLARLLTRAGDHAWGLAMPLALLIAVPGTMRGLAAYYLVTRLAVVVAMPLLGRWIDESDRLHVVRTGIVLEVFGVAGAAVVFTQLAGTPAWLLPCVIAAGVVAQIGSTTMAVVLPGRWVPALFTGRDLVLVNSRLKQCDLVSEVAAPVVAGSLMAFASSPAHPYRGFQIVALLNLASFVLEYLLLADLYRGASQLAPSQSASVASPDAKPLREAPPPAASVADTALNPTAPPPVDGAPPDPTAPHTTPAFTGAFGTFLAQPTLPVMLAYGLLWFTVLTPHGALLAAFLKTQWKLDEQMLGLVRGVGALCGLAPTLFYGRLVAALGVRATAAGCLGVQITALVCACIALHSHAALAATAFIVTLMASRIGLYGFVLAEVQIFQEHVPDSVRGRVGAVASSYNNAMGLLIYAVAMVISDTADFPTLAWASCGSVGLAAVLVTLWAVR